MNTTRVSTVGLTLKFSRAQIKLFTLSELDQFTSQCCLNQIECCQNHQFIFEIQMDELFRDFTQFRHNIKSQYNAQLQQKQNNSLQQKNRSQAAVLGIPISSPNSSQRSSLSKLPFQLSQERNTPHTSSAVVNKYLAKQSAVLQPGKITIASSKPPQPRKFILDSGGKEQVSFQTQSTHTDSSFVQKFLQRQNKENMITLSSQHNSGQKSFSDFSCNPHKSNILDTRTIDEQIPIKSLQMIQDMLIDCSEKEFNQLNGKYIEEMIKLSSVIMYRVKHSRFYKQVDI